MKFWSFQLGSSEKCEWNWTIIIFLFELKKCHQNHQRHTQNIVQQIESIWDTHPVYACVLENDRKTGKRFSFNNCFSLLWQVHKHTGPESCHGTEGHHIRMARCWYFLTKQLGGKGGRKRHGERRDVNRGRGCPLLWGWPMAECQSNISVMWPAAVDTAGVQ